MIRTDIESSELMLLQYSLSESLRTFTTLGQLGWADFTRNRLRILINEGYVSVETVGYAGQAARRARELEAGR